MTRRMATCEHCGREFRRAKHEREGDWPLCPRCEQRPEVPVFNEDSLVWERTGDGDYEAVRISTRPTEEDER